LYAQRFERGAYQPQHERDRVADLVRRAARDCGVTGHDAYERTSPVQITPSTQLSLL
jgi:hypothetical protein